jgi:Ni,Fe-hydrogenase III small subunit
MLKDLRIFRKHGIQYVRDLRNVSLSPLFRGRPVIQTGIQFDEQQELVRLCPSGAIDTKPLTLDLGKCIFCRECEFASAGKIRFINDFRIATNRREYLKVKEGETTAIQMDTALIRPEVRRLFRGALKLRQVSAGGDNSTEMELNAAGNVNFDMGRYGIQFVASPRHADGMVVTGPVTANMATALQLTWEAIPEPKILILAGTDAISGGLFAQSPTLNRQFMQNLHVDLYVPGNPAHPLTFINGILDLVGRK